MFEPLGHIPLMVAWPGVAPGATDALTTNVDIFATLADLFGVTPEHRTHGRSLLPVITGEAKTVREYALSGVWGREVHLIDGDDEVRARAGGRQRAAVDVVEPLVDDADRPRNPEYASRVPDDRASLDRMPGRRAGDPPAVPRRATCCRSGRTAASAATTSTTWRTTRRRTRTAPGTTRSAKRPTGCARR